jgi:rhodanese-related sulfurtransferase
MRKSIVILVFTTLLFSACQDTKQNNNTQNETETKSGGEEVKSEQPKVISEILSPEKFIEKFKSIPGAQMVDVRTTEEVAKGKVENALNIDIYSKKFDEEISKLDKSKAIFVYCKGGTRSAEAANKCKELGFKEIYDMEGGWDKYSSEKKK